MWGGRKERQLGGVCGWQALVKGLNRIIPSSVNKQEPLLSVREKSIVS